MSSTALPLQQLCDAAIRAARAAGEFIQGLDREKIKQHYKDSGSSSASQLVTEVDIRSEAIIRECLNDSCTQWDIAFIGEESSHDAQGQQSERFSKSHFWCVDPLDGTLPFVEGIPGYAVSIALVERSGTPLVGVVCDPASGTLMHAIKGRGAYKNLHPMHPENEPFNPLIVFADLSFQTMDNYNDTVRVLKALANDLSLIHISEPTRPKR